jgi:glycosyltransferase involved in cell wall biosynthesis
MDLSIVIPVYNEEESVKPLIEEIVTAAAPLEKQYEIIIVDDGSSDGTFPLLAASSATSAKPLRSRRAWRMRKATSS